MKFTAQGEIKVSMRAAADRMSVDLEIADSGAGIDPSILATIFEPFQQLDVLAHRPSSGLGLGLSVARRMALLIGATIDISSEVGQGTRVAMHFPSHPPRPEALVEQPSRADRLPGTRVQGSTFKGSNSDGSPSP